VIGTMGQLPAGSITLVQTLDDARTFTPRDVTNLAYVTQTTLSVDDTGEIVALLKERFPHIVGPHKEDICYATTNRQEAVKRIAGTVDAVIVVGSPNSSNSQRLREVAERNGARRAVLVQGAAELDWSILVGAKRIGVTAGASAPEVLVEEILDALAGRYTVDIEIVRAVDEDVVFPLPRPLRGEAAE
jgi:4-hydroxy-3-methylbut-2-enyl diphosphate reductase